MTVWCLMVKDSDTNCFTLEAIYGNYQEAKAKGEEYKASFPWSFDYYVEPTEILGKIQDNR